MRGIAGKFETGEPPRLVGRQLQRLDLGGDGDAHPDQAGFHGDLAQLIERRQPLGNEQPLRMTVIAAAPVGHGGDRQHAHGNAEFALQPGLQRAGKVVAGIEQRGERLRLFLDRRKMVGPRARISRAPRRSAAWRRKARSPCPRGRAGRKGRTAGRPARDRRGTALSPPRLHWAPPRRSRSVPGRPATRRPAAGRRTLP